jgi:peptide/nickel transport system permease protein
MRTQFGYDQPVPVQYARWLATVARGDLGYSRSWQQPVTTVLATTLPNTLMLIVPAFLLSIAGGMIVGAWQGTHVRSTRDRVTSVLLLVLYSVPEFAFAMVLLVLAVQWLGAPAGGITSEMYDYMTPLAQWRDRATHIVLPLLSVSLIGVATFARYQRSSMQEAMQHPSVRTATASGLTPSQVRRRAWRTSLLPVITLGGVLLPSYLAGVVFVEQVFSWPGMGSMTVQAVLARDYYLVAGTVIVGSALTAGGAALADLLRDIADPRLRTLTSTARGAA